MSGVGGRERGGLLTFFCLRKNQTAEGEKGGRRMMGPSQVREICGKRQEEEEGHICTIADEEERT